MFLVEHNGFYDYGTDFSLEILKQEKHPSNLKISIQLKAIDKLEKTAIRSDGSYSLQIESSNHAVVINFLTLLSSI